MDNAKLIIPGYTVTLSLQSIEKLAVTPELGESFEKAIQGVVDEYVAASQKHVKTNGHKPEVRMPQARFDFFTKPL